MTVAAVDVVEDTALVHKERFEVVTLPPLRRRKSLLPSLMRRMWRQNCRHTVQSQQQQVDAVQDLKTSCNPLRIVDSFQSWHLEHYHHRRFVYYSTMKLLLTVGTATWLVVATWLAREVDAKCAKDVDAPEVVVNVMMRRVPTWRRVSALVVPQARTANRWKLLKIWVLFDDNDPR